MYKIVCYITTRKILTGFYVSVVNFRRQNVLKEGWNSVSPHFCMNVVCMWVVCVWYEIILQDHRYLDPPILDVQRRFRVERQHPNSQSPHTSNSVKNCVLSPTTSSE